jgi:hypothetical protein
VKPKPPPNSLQLYFPEEAGARLAAALLIPINQESVTALAETMLRPSQAD